MTVYIDYPRHYSNLMINSKARRYGNLWCHMFSDDLNELHNFAKSIGLNRNYFQNHSVLPHYDLTPNKRNLALLRGAEKKYVIDFLRERRNNGNQKIS